MFGDEVGTQGTPGTTFQAAANRLSTWTLWQCLLSAAVSEPHLGRAENQRPLPHPTQRGPRPARALG
jgi:hypothetical protein